VLDHQEKLEDLLRQAEDGIALALAQSRSSSAMCARSSGRFGRVRAKRRNSFAWAWVQA
jgi:hypothetical protein